MAQALAEWYHEQGSVYARPFRDEGVTYALFVTILKLCSRLGVEDDISPQSSVDRCSYRSLSLVKRAKYTDAPERCVPQLLQENWRD